MFFSPAETDSKSDSGSRGVSGAMRFVLSSSRQRVVLSSEKFAAVGRANRDASGRGALVPPPSPGMRLNVHLQTTESDPF